MTVQEVIEKLEAILKVANEIHKYAEKITVEDMQEEITILGDNVIHLSKEVLRFSDMEIEDLYDTYYGDYLIGKNIKFEEVIDKFMEKRFGVK